MLHPAPLQTWSAEMRSQDLTPATIKERQRFYLYLETHIGVVTEISRSDLIQFLGTEGWSNTTRQHYRSALHTLFTWLQDEGYRPDNPSARLPKIKARKRRPNPLTADEIRRVLNCGTYKRTRIMVALHYYQGLRVHEIAKVHGHDVDLEGRTITVFGKGAKTRTLPLNAEMWTLAQTMPQAGYWFPNWKTNRLYAARDGHILSNSVSTVISLAIRRAGIRGHRPHDLRASTATLQTRAGVDAFIVKENMRHELMATTALYELVDIEDMRRGLDQLPVAPMPAHSNRRHAA